MTVEMMIVSTTPATAAKAHLRDPTWLTMMLPSRLTLRPDSDAAVANSPKTITETKIVPTTTPGIDSGRTMRKKIVLKDEPRSRAASITDASMRAIMNVIGPTMNTQ